MFGFKKESKVTPDESGGGGILGLSASRGSLLSEAEEPQITRAWCYKEEKSESWDKWMKFFGKIDYWYIKDSTKFFMDSAHMNVRISVDDVMMAMTLFVLFADNIRLMGGPKGVDNDFIIVNSVCLFSFILEFILNNWSKTTDLRCTMESIGFPGLPGAWEAFRLDVPWLNKKGYLFSFFWWLDLIAILSMFPDIPWIANPLGMGGISNSLSTGSSVTKVGRVLRLVRLVRLIKLYKIAQERRQKAKEEEELMDKVNSGAIRYEDVLSIRELNSTRQSKLGEQLSESTTRRVVVIVLIMVCILPLFEVSQANLGPEFGTRFLAELNTLSSISDSVKSTIIDQYQSTFEDAPTGIRPFDYLLTLYMTPYSSNILSSLQPKEYGHELNTLREEAIDEHVYSSTSGGTTYYTRAVFSNRYLEYDNAFYSTLTTIFIAVLLVAGSLVFTNDTQNMVINPIERMMNMVEAVAKDPLQPLSFDHSESGGTGQYETRLLESTIEKITGLLRVGFGEAGAGIISTNLATQKEGQTSSVNPLLPGVRIYAVIGFCDIHHFDDCLDLLKDDVLVFVNTIAEIVHSRVHYWGGQVNKNLGNAFVIIWRIGDELDVQLQTQGAGGGKGVSGKMSGKGSGGSATPGKAGKVVDLRRVPGVDKLSDHALVAYLKIIAEINRNPAILAYREEPRLTEGGTKEFKVRMGFGLHAGWAIEGAVGSIHKVDATYLSPHVNMAARLETSSRQYGVPILISQNAYDLFSPDTQAVVRRCDVVTVKGSEVPIGIYTYDALQNQQFPMKFIQGVEAEDEGLVELCPEEVEATFEINARRREAGLPEIESFPINEIEDWEDETEPVWHYQGALGAIAHDDITFQRNAVDSQDLFDLDTDLCILRAHAAREEFIAIFKEGVDQYLDGDWEAARGKLEKANEMMKSAAPNLETPGDGPCLTLLKYMKEFGPKAPDWWKGFRPLTAK